MIRGAARFISLVTLVAAALAAAPVHAQSESADILFDQGRKLMAKKDYAGAARALEQSNKVDPAAGTLLNLAECYIKLGRNASAWSAYRDAASLASQNQETAREKYAEKKAAQLAPTLSTIKIVVPAAARVKGLSISRNGVAVPSALWGQSVPLDPGTVTVKANAPGKQDWSTQATLTGNAQHLTLTIPALEDQPAPAPAKTAATPPPAATPPSTLPNAPPPAAPPPTHDTGSSTRLVGYIVGGAGIVGAAVGTGLYLHSQSTISGANCPNHQCVEGVGNITQYNLGRDQEKVGFAVIGIGGALLVTGVVLVLAAPHGSTGSTTALRVAPRAGGGFVGLSHTF